MQGRARPGQLFSFGGARPAETTGDRLHALALALQPLLAERERVLTDPTLAEAMRERHLNELSRALQRAGLDRFRQQVEVVCRAYRRRYGDDPGGDGEEFVAEVLTLTLCQLAGFNPAQARFPTWFGACILPRVYADLRRRRDPGWGRPLPKTTDGQFVRQTARNLAANLSLDQTSPDCEQPLAERVSDRRICAEQQLLEDWCREFFLQAVASLGEVEQALLRRVYLLAEPQKQIAASLGVTPGAVSLRLKKVYSRLADQLGASFEAECADTQFCDVLRRTP